jgi:putative DNA primase/helicase
VREAQPYLVCKGVSPVPSLREIDAGAAEDLLGYAPKCRDKPLVGRLLVVPVKVDGTLSTLELIDETGRKPALYGGAKAGGYWAAQPLPNGDGAGLTLLIGEDVATVLSAREATGYLVIAALSSGNLLAVAREMRERYPKAVLVILVDLIKATGEPNPHAVQAACAVAGLVAVPDFGENRPEPLKDFNELAVHQGREAVGECIRRQIFSKDDVPDVPDVPGAANDPAPEAEDPASVPEDDLIPPLSERPCFRVFDEWIEHQNGKLRPGVWFSGSSKQGGPRIRRPSPSNGCARPSMCWP